MTSYLHVRLVNHMTFHPAELVPCVHSVIFDSSLVDGKSSTFVYTFARVIACNFQKTQMSHFDCMRLQMRNLHYICTL